MNMDKRVPCGQFMGRRYGELSVEDLFDNHPVGEARTKEEQEFIWDFEEIMKELTEGDMQ